MTDKSDSSLARMLGVLDLFNEQQLTWTAEAIASALQVSLPTGYRYVRLLTESGLLQRTADSQYTLGPRIVVLDHYIRQADPVLQHGVPFMKELVETTGFDCVISSLHGHQLLDTHREFGPAPESLSYGRGRPRPLFLGAAAKVIVAHMPPAQLRKLFDTRQGEIAEARLPTEWSAFRRYYAAIRKAGFYFSNGELEPNLAAVGVPLVHASGSVLGAMSLVTTVHRMAVIDMHRLTPLLTRAAQDIVSRIP